MNLSVIETPARALPVNIDAEQGFLGALLVNNSIHAHVSNFLAPHHFSEPVHARIYEVACCLIAEGKTVTPITLRDFFGGEDFGGMTIWQYIVRLREEAHGVLIAIDYAKIIVEAACRRAIIDAGQDMIGQAYALPTGGRASEIAIGAIGALQAISESTGDKNTRRDAGASAGALLDHIARVKGGEVAKAGVPFGVPDIDRDTGGFMPGTLWVVGARPGMGKTILSCSEAVHVALSGVGALLFSLEVPEDQVSARILSDMTFSARSPIQFGRILREDVNDLEERRLIDAKRDLDLLPLVIDVAPRLSVTEISLRVRAEKERMVKRGFHLGVVFIDYLKFVKASDRYRGQRVYEVGEISASLKELAKSEGVCVVLLAQLNRALENRDDKRPYLSDLRESGDLEADADVVAFIHREAYYIQASSEFKLGHGDAVSRFAELENVAEIIIAKNRAGAVRGHEIWCDVSCSKIGAKVWRRDP